MRNLQSVRAIVSGLWQVKVTNFLWAAALGMSLSLSASSARATNYSWTGAVNNNWLTTGNWDSVGAPDDAGDTATLTNLSAATLGSNTTIGGLNLSGTNPTVTLNSILTIQGGTSNIGGGVINGTGGLKLTNNPTINWTGGSLGGSAYILLPTLQNAMINNDAGAFSLGSGQSIRLGDLPIDVGTSSILTFANGFSNSGEIRLGAVPPAVDVYGIYRMVVNAGTLTNNVGGNINLYPRSATGGGTYGTREVRANIQNDGIITSFTNDGNIGGTGLTVTNAGTIRTSHAVFNSANNIPALTITGATFTNTGNLEVGASDGGLGGGRMTILSDTINLNAGSNITGPGTLLLGGNTVNINSGTTFSGLNVLGFGRNNASTIVNWNIPDLTSAITFRLDAGANITLNRTGAWNIPTNQVLEFSAPSSPLNVPMSLNMNEDINNSGLVRMGLPQPGDNFVQAHINLSGTKTFTNNADGIVEMWTRGPGSAGDTTWNIRNINANVVNNGLMNDYASNARLGTTDKTVVNNGTINVNSSFFTGGGRAMLQLFGSSFTNNSTGAINLNDGILWINTSMFNYDGGTITATGNSEIDLGSSGLTTNINFNGGADITGPVKWFVKDGSVNNINRTSTWNILAGQSLEYQVQTGQSQARIISNQDITNSGVILLGKNNPAGDNFVQQWLSFTGAGTRLTNNADGQIFMYPRSATSTDDTSWSQRRIEGELINNGHLTVATRFGNIGKAGSNHVNNGTIAFDNSIYASGPLGYQPTLYVTGSTFTNDTNGVIKGNGILNVAALPGSVFTNTGTLSPGLSAGILTIQGNVNNQLGSKLLIEITGENAVVGVDYDQLIVNGGFNNLSLTDLVVNVADLDFDLTGDVFTILTANTDFTNLSFHSVSIAGAGNFKGDLIYGNGFIQLTNVVSYVPEPSTGLLLLVGLVALRKRNGRKAAC